MPPTNRIRQHAVWLKRQIEGYWLRQGRIVKVELVPRLGRGEDGEEVLDYDVRSNLRNGLPQELS